MISARNRQTGLTLIEVMVSLAIVATIMGFGYRMYMSQFAKQMHSDAIMALKQLRVAMEQFRSDNGVYDVPAGAVASAAYQSSRPAATVLECQANRGYQLGAAGPGITSCRGYYNIAIAVPDVNSYTITATPFGATTLTGAYVAGDDLPADPQRCANFIIDNLGRETIAGAAAGVTAGECWSN